MGPGPSDVPDRILQALARPTLGHLDPDFVSMMDEIKHLLQYAFQTDHELTMAVSAPGSAGMETCFVNLVQPGDTVIVCVNGVFGGRMKENVTRCGGIAVLVEDAWGSPVSPEKLETALQENPGASLVAFVHAETSTGVCSDAQALANIAHAHDCLVIADTVTSLGGSPLLVDDWKLDAVYSGSQKCLSCTPGLSPITFSQAAVDRFQSRTTPVQSWFLDLNLVTAYWGGGKKRSYHHTAPVNALYGLHEALVMLAEEGLQARWDRHASLHMLLRNELEALGLEFAVDASCRLPQLNAVCIPDGVDDAAVRTTLLREHHIEIGAGLGPLASKVWRIGLMGYACREENIQRLVSALKPLL